MKLIISIEEEKRIARCIGKIRVVYVEVQGVIRGIYVITQMFEDVGLMCELNPSLYSRMVCLQQYCTCTCKKMEEILNTNEENL